MNKIIAAVTDKASFITALSSSVDTIFLLSSDILSLGQYSEYAKKYNKKLYVHFDFAQGIGKDNSGIEFVKSCGVYGIISVKGNIIKYANSIGLNTVQRFFIIDSRSIDTALDSIKNTKPNIIEIMPGILPKVVGHFAGSIQTPIIAGGLIQTASEVKNALDYGAAAVSTSKKELWEKDI